VRPVPHSAGARDWAGGWTGEGFTHEAFVFSDDAAVRDRVVPFVEEGLSRGEPVIVVADDVVRRVLATALDSRIDDLTVFSPSEGFWLGGHETLAVYHGSMEPLLATGEPWRIVGEPTWLAQPGGEAWSRFEAVANEAFADYPYYSLCLHDRRRLDPDLVDAQLRAHPLVWDGDAPAPSPSYEPTDVFLHNAEPAWRPPAHGVRTLEVDDLLTAPAALAAWIDFAAVRSRADAVRLAVHELVVNAVQAAGRARVSEWQEAGRAVWQIQDSGPGLSDPTVGYVLPVDALESGRGLWIARSLADDSSVRSTPHGTTIQLMFRTDSP
jgi:anti-sigma regulatory factor (Ser/Thr protein kinase)